MVTTLGLVLEPTGSIIFNEWTGKGRVGGRPAEVVRPRPVPDPFIHFWYLHIFTCHSAFWHFFSAFCAAHSEMQNAISDGCLRQDFHAGRSPLQYRLAAGQPHPARIISRRLLPLDKLFEELLQPHYSRLQPQTRVPLCFGLFIVGCLNLWTTVRPERLAIGCSESKRKRSRQTSGSIHCLHVTQLLGLWFSPQVLFGNRDKLYLRPLVCKIYDSRNTFSLGQVHCSHQLLAHQVQSNNCNLFRIAVKFYFHF